MTQRIIKTIVSFCLFFLLYSLQGFSQVVADPANGQMDITDQAGLSLNANFIAPSASVTLLIPVYNLNQLVALPAGSCKFIVTLGNNMILDPSFNLTTAPLNNYFSWTSATVSGKVQITGNLTALLPEDLNGIAAFKVKASTTLGTSIIESDFLVTNHSTATPLKDEDVNNNNATLTYTVTMRTLPVTFTGLLLTKKECDIQVNFTTENEINVKQYEIELSKDGVHYAKLGVLSAKNIPRYQYNFSLTGINTANIIFIRIKSVDLDGKFDYSDVKKTGGKCDNNHQNLLRIYPNPYTDQNSSLVIDKNGQGIFNGLYKISLMEAGGKIIESKQLKLNNAPQINYTPRVLRAGTYYLKLESLDELITSTIKILKL